MFDPSLANTFQSYTIYHLIPVLVVFFFIFLIIFYKDKLRSWKHLTLFTYILAGLTLGQELSLNIYRIVLGQWEIATSLPLQLCGLGVLTSAYLLITKNEKVFQNVFFIMMIGATMAILTPAIEENLGFPHYRYFQFFFSHGMILINFTVLLFVYNFQKNMRYRLLLNNFIALVGIAAVMFLVNLVTGGNYLYLMGKPGEGTAFDLFGEWPWYVLNLLIFGIPIFFHLFYIPFFIRDFRRYRKQKALLSA